MKNSLQALLYYLRLFFIRQKLSMGYYWGSSARLQKQIRNLERVFLPSLLRKFGANIGQPINFNGSIILDNFSLEKNPFKNLFIGNHCFIGTDVFFDLPDQIILHDEVVLSAGVKILTHQDTGARKMSHYYPRKQAQVEIGEGTWIGVDAVILSGVKIGKFCVIAAGAVVTQDVEDYSVMGGIPAKWIKSIKI